MTDTTSNERAALVDYARTSNLRNDPLVIDMADMIETDGEVLALAEKTMRVAQGRLQKFGLFDEAIDGWLAGYEAAKADR